MTVPPSVVLNSAEHARELLTSDLTRLWAEHFLNDEPWTRTDIIKKSVDGSTLRAFHTRKFGHTPSSLHRSWAEDFLEESADRLLIVQSQAEFDERVEAAAHGMISQWRRDVPAYDLTFGRAAKLLNLVLKHVARSATHSEAARRQLWGQLHVALDKFTLRPLARLDSRFRSYRQGSMGSIVDPIQYREVQQFIRQFCAESGVPPIYWDVCFFQMPKNVEAPHGVPSAHAKTSMSARSIAGRPTRTIRRRSSDDSRPHTDPLAGVVGRRIVNNATVVHAESAHFRGSTFKGALEIIPDRGSMIESDGRFPCVITWFGRMPQCGFARVRVKGARIEENYSGEVISDLGRMHAADA